MDKKEQKKMFGQFLRRQRNKIGKNQSEIAKEVKRCTALISNWERGTNMPSFDIFPLLARVLELEESDLYAALNTCPKSDAKHSLITLEDVMFLLEIQRGLPNTMPKEFVVELLKKRYE